MVSRRVGEWVMGRDEARSARVSAGMIWARGR